MCRNIKNLFNFDPPATEEEIRGAAVQFVRKVSSFQKPSEANTAAFDQAIEETVSTITNLLNSLQTNQNPRNREVEILRAKERSLKRFGK